VEIFKPYSCTRDFLRFSSAAAVTGSVPAGPEQRERPPLRLVPDAAPVITGALCAADSG
jgi:hypothetical protein